MLSHGPKHTCITLVTDQCRQAGLTPKRCRPKDAVAQGADQRIATGATAENRGLKRNANFGLKETAEQETDVNSHMENLSLKMMRKQSGWRRKRPVSYTHLTLPTKA